MKQGVCLTIPLNMARYKIYSVVSLLLIIQAFHCLPIEYSSQEVESILAEYNANATIADQVILFKLANYQKMPYYYAGLVANATKHLLKDDALMAQQTREVLEFKKNLTRFLQQYDPLANVPDMLKTMDTFFSTTDPYMQLDDKEVSAESKFIHKLLNKYNFMQNAKKFNILKLAVNEVGANATASEKLLTFTLDNLIILPQQYAANATNATQYLLKDESLKANNKPEVLEFKNKLKGLLERYDPSGSHVLPIFATMDNFANMTAHYLQLPEQQLTRQTKFIQHLLIKYDCENIAMTVFQHMTAFMEKFSEMFEEFSADLDEPLLEWFEKYESLSDFQQKFESMTEFVDLLKIK